MRGNPLFQLRRYYISDQTDGIYGKRDSSRCHRTYALYQGQTLVGPPEAKQRLGFNRLRKEVEQGAKAVPSAAKAGPVFNVLRTA
jgi:hypothetical protein